MFVLQLEIWTKTWVKLTDWLTDWPTDWPVAKTWRVVADVYIKYVLCVYHHLRSKSTAQLRLLFLE